jgi:hypothetical protein
VGTAIKQMRDKKATGDNDDDDDDDDDVPGDVLKSLGAAGLKLVTLLIIRIYKTGD